MAISIPFQILRGPGKTDLMFAAFDRADDKPPRRINITIRWDSFGKSVCLPVSVEANGHTHSDDWWVIGGKVYIDDPDLDARDEGVKWARGMCVVYPYYRSTYCTAGAERGRFAFSDEPLIDPDILHMDRG